MQKKPTLLFVLGTRPEAIKCASVIQACRADADLDTRVLTTSQHRALQDDVLQFFHIQVDHDLDLMREQPDLTSLIRDAWFGVSTYLHKNPTDMVLVQGDTTTAFIAALAAQYQRVPVAHIEAGLRTYDKSMPFPEEMNRRLISHSADLHFAPTPAARENLIHEQIPAERIHVVGNPGIDALLHILRQPQTEIPLHLDPQTRLLLVTSHRRENWGENLRAICAALRTIAQECPNVHILFLVHPNPQVATLVNAALAHEKAITLRSAVSYSQMAGYLHAATVILTDSGGIQEEAPVLGKPVLVLREKTERPEGVACASSFLVGANPEKMIALTKRLLNDPAFYAAHAQPASPYGDGRAAQRIHQGICHSFNMAVAPVPFIPQSQALSPEEMADA
ncbi:MAG: UDP-N-acetylglucosamine 2-epimerase (non-hydrolyzing) [bacterium]|jgi:UDP-N-acetylglucosamine 2-epimerase (non-hydrolysing)|nr:UDP-N-acetylglucosamine 2-epimerase (non-hydrolyzing) [bacterium]